MKINKNNFIDYLNQESNYECHNIIFNILKMYNISYSKNNNGIFINYDNLNDNIIEIIINYINDYIKKKYINNKILHKQQLNKEINNIDTSFSILLSTEQIKYFNIFQEMITHYNYRKYNRVLIIKKKYNCKVNNVISYDNTLNNNIIKKENYLL
jgi:hypothetical protein